MAHAKLRPSGAQRDAGVPFLEIERVLIRRAGRQAAPGGRASQAKPKVPSWRGVIVQLQAQPVQQLLERLLILDTKVEDILIDPLLAKLSVELPDRLGLLTGWGRGRRLVD